MDLNLARWIIAVLVGVILGWMAGEFWKRRLVGIAGNILLGVIGALLGANLFARLNLPMIGVAGASAMAVMVAGILLIVMNILIPCPANLPE